MTYEVRFHGRGGQGVVIASKILAVAAFLEGKQVQSFPEFGVERRGAPVTAYLRVSEKSVMVRSGIEQPDCIVVLEPTLVQDQRVFAGLKKGGFVLLNWPSAKVPQLNSKLKVAVVNASKIAVECELGTVTSPIVNTAIVGAFARITELVRLESTLEAIRKTTPAKIEQNCLAAKQAFEQCKLL